jgi:hypothetical protein
MLMLKTATVLEAISKRRRTARPAAHTGMSKNTIFAATHSAEDALVLLDATADGLNAEHAAERLDAVGPNTIEAPTKTLARRIADAFIDPFAGILAALAGAEDQHVEIDPDLAQQVAAARAVGGKVDAGRGVHGRRSARPGADARMRAGAWGDGLP